MYVFWLVSRERRDGGRGGESGGDKALIGRKALGFAKVWISSSMHVFW